MLYKKDSKGRIRVWAAYAEGDKLIIVHGLLDGKKITKVKTCTPKNVGKSNESTAERQAAKECGALILKQIERNGYTTNASGVTSYRRVMLARDFNKLKHQVQLKTKEWVVEPKLDGVRVLLIDRTLEGNLLDEPYFLSRKGTIYKPLNSLAKEAAIYRRSLELPDNALLDGEIYKHGVPLDYINSACKKENDLTSQLSFCIFDNTAKDIEFYKRKKALTSSKYQYFTENNVEEIPRYLIRIDTEDNEYTRLYLINSEDTVDNIKDLENFHKRVVSFGFEGVMIKNLNGFYYEGVRSDGIYKKKFFKEREFLILDILPDLDGQSVILYEIPEISEGKNTFKSRIRGENELRIEMLLNKQKYIGKMGTVRFQDYSSKNIPTFPVTIAIGQDK